ncbi:unnamed protein product [Amoebophrya sp. A25]|nr:unnamed protein product [Amoebophrya sp. A25]|eukprot:GSA25T00006840001.1
MTATDDPSSSATSTPHKLLLYPNLLNQIKQNGGRKKTVAMASRLRMFAHWNSDVERRRVKENLPAQQDEELFSSVEVLEIARLQNLREVELATRFLPSQHDRRNKPSEQTQEELMGQEQRKLQVLKKQNQKKSSKNLNGVDHEGEASIKNASIFETRAAAACCSPVSGGTRGGKKKKKEIREISRSKNKGERRVEAKRAYQAEQEELRYWSKLQRKLLVGINDENEENNDNSTTRGRVGEQNGNADSITDSRGQEDGSARALEDVASRGLLKTVHIQLINGNADSITDSREQEDGDNEGREMP